MPGKSELADRIAARGWSKAAASSAVDAVLDEITAALAAGERVTLTGFGTFESAGRAARTARNPQTGASIDVPATTVARFHPGATLRSRVASGAAVSLAALTAEPVGALAEVATPAAPVVSSTPKKAPAPAKSSAPKQAKAAPAKSTSSQDADKGKKSAAAKKPTVTTSRKKSAKATVVVGKKKSKDTKKKSKDAKKKK